MLDSVDNANSLPGDNVNRQKSHASGSLFPELKGFKVCQINIASLIKHYDELLIYMQNKLFYIITLNETRLDSSVLNGEIEIRSLVMILSGVIEIEAEEVLRYILEATYHTSFEKTS